MSFALRPVPVLLFVATLAGPGRGEDPKPLRKFKLAGPLSNAVLTTDGKTLATLSSPTPSGGSSELRTWDFGTSTPKAGPYKLDASSYSDDLAIRPDGTFAAVGGFDNAIRIFDLTRDVGPTKLAVKGRTVRVAFSPDGKRLAALTVKDEEKPNGRRIPLSESVRVWEVAGWKPIGEPEMREKVTGWLAFGADGKLIPPLMGAKPASELVHPEPPAAAGEPKGDGKPAGLGLNADGTFAVTGGFAGTVAVHDRAAGKLRGDPVLLAAGTWVTGIAVAPDGHSAAATTLVYPRSGTKLWFIALDKPKAIGDPITISSDSDLDVTGARPVAFTPDGKAVLVAVSRRGPGAQTTLSEIQVWAVPARR